MSASITFMGAARTVTGSRHLLTINGRKILVDCGLFQGPREVEQMNWTPFAVPPSEIDAVVVTHAHTDHIGLLPRLAAQGFRGPVYATPGSIGIARISLPDGGRIQEEDARWHNRHKTSRHTEALPLFTESDAYQALKLFQPVRYGELHELPGGAQFRFLPAGHILGASFAEIYFESGERVLMSGDLGRKDRPIIKDPTIVDWAEHLVLESTYGNRLHEDDDPQVILERLVNRAAEEGTTMLIPSFAIGRTQELLWHLHQLLKAGRIPQVPIFIDSPMASAATLITLQSKDDHDDEMKVSLEEGKSPFRSDMVQFVRDRQASKALNRQRGAQIIIAGSGMCSGGRIIHHLKNRLDDPKTTVLFTGFQAQGTRGRQILEGAETVTIHRDVIPVRARIEKINGLSAHADQQEIMDWLGNFRQPPRTTFLVHGELDAAEALQARIQAELGWTVEIPRRGDRRVLED
jgi:metallo-beta-lactamase family protein